MQTMQAFSGDELTISGFQTPCSTLRIREAQSAFRTLVAILKRWVLENLEFAAILEFTFVLAQSTMWSLRCRVYTTPISGRLKRKSALNRSFIVLSGDALFASNSPRRKRLTKRLLCLPNTPMVRLVLCVPTLISGAYSGP